MTVVPTAPAGLVVDTPAHRDGNVLRWLAAYTASMIGDSVYYIALSWAAVQAGSPAQAAWSWRSVPCRGPCSCWAAE